MTQIHLVQTSASRIQEVDFSNIPFGRIFTDHMFMVDYSEGEWKNPRIQPYGPLPLSPALSCMHYGQAIFEGMKAYKSEEGSLLTFRPEENWKRLNRSAHRMCMPELPKELFMDGLNAYLNLDADWVPGGPGGALYIRPFMIATDDFLGVKPSQKYSFIIYGCPVGAYYTEALRLRVEQKYVRAAAGGVGAAKAAGNYAAAMYPASLAQQQGFHQLLWTDGQEHKYIEELGTSNFFARIGDVLVTPALNGTILEGITRESIVQIAKDLAIPVEERPLSVDELRNAWKNGTLKEAFATGTAATVAPIALIRLGEDDIALNTGTGTWAEQLGDTLNRIKKGQAEDTHGWVVRVPEMLLA